MSKAHVITPRNAADIIMENERLHGVPELGSVVAEGKTLRVVRAEPFLWRNLSKKAYEILTDELCAKIERDCGVRLARKKRSGPAAVMNCNAHIGDDRSIEDCLISGTSGYLFFTVARDANQVKTTWFNC